VANIKTYLGEIEWGGVDWIDLTVGRDQWRTLVDEVMNLQVLCWEVFEWLHN
jgi:hypothetical protein